MSWTKAEIDAAVEHARVIAQCEGHAAQVVRHGRKLRAVKRALPTDEVIVKDVEAEFLSYHQIMALSEIMAALPLVHETFAQMWRTLSAKPDGKPWPPEERRQIVEAVARSWETIDRRVAA